MKNTDIHRLLSRYYETWAGINAAYDRIAARCGVTSNVLYLLDTLYCAEAPMTQSEIGARLGLPKQTVASMVSTNSLHKQDILRQICFYIHIQTLQIHNGTVNLIDKYNCRDLQLL